MLKYILGIIAVVSLYSCKMGSVTNQNTFKNSSKTKACDISVMTYNVRIGIAKDGENSWEYRKEFLTSQVNFYNPDFVGTQEGMPFQINYINEKLPHHSFVGQSREGNGKGEYSAIFYNKEKFESLETNTFWLSETPNKFSKGWDSAYPRICTYGLFKDRETNKVFWVVNTHLDHKGEVAREEGIKLILNKIKQINTENYPLIFMGDLNAEPESKPILIMKSRMKNTREISIAKPFGSYGTFNNFEFEKQITKLIDYIFVSDDKLIQVNKYAVLSDSKDLKYPSDHLPVYVELTIK